MENKKKWTTIGSLRTGANGSRNLVFAKNVEILVDGQPVDLGTYRTAKCFDAIDGVNAQLASGKTTQENADRRLSYINDKNIKFDIVLPPNDEDGSL